MEVKGGRKRWLVLISGLLILASGIMAAYVVKRHLQDERKDRLTSLLERFTQASLVLRVNMGNELGTAGIKDITSSDDIKNIPVLGMVRDNLEKEFRIRVSFDSSMRILLHDTGKSLDTISHELSGRIPDSLFASIRDFLATESEILDSGRVSLAAYHQLYINLITLLIGNNEKLSVENGSVVINDKPFGIAFNRLQVEFAREVEKYTGTSARLKKRETDALRRIGAIFPAPGIEALCGLIEGG